jgi:hypothetical protein
MTTTEEATSRPIPWYAWIRWILYAYAIAFAVMQELFVIDVMDFLDIAAVPVLGSALLLVILIRVWILLRLGRIVWNRVRYKAAWPPMRGFLVVAALACSPLVLNRLVPKLSQYSFLWRHETRLLRAIEAQESSDRVRHYTHGSSFKFSWYTFTDAWYILIYEPDRPAGHQPLQRDTSEFYPAGLDFDVHLWGPWYGAVH